MISKDCVFELLLRLDSIHSQYINAIKKYKFSLPLLLIIFVAAIVRCYEITRPYQKTYEIGFQEVIARNHFIYGFGQTHFLSVISVIDGQNIYHLNHQPLLQILISFSYFFFGIHEWSARLVPIVFSLGSIIFIYSIAEKVWDQRTALFAAFFAAFMPMSAYFGRIVNFEPLVLFFVLLFSWAYLIWSETGNKKFYDLAIFAVILGGLTDWPFFLILPFFVLISLITQKKIWETGILFILGCGVAAGYLAVKSSVIGYQSGVSSWFSFILNHRSNIPTFIGNPELYSRIVQRAWNYFSITIFLAVIGIIICLYLIRKRHINRMKLKVKELIPLILFLFGLSYLTIFLQSAFIHDWQMYYLIPGISLFAGFTLSNLFSLSLANQTRKVLLKPCCFLVIILFLGFSIISLMTLHSAIDSGPYYFGSLINERTAPEDNICIIGLTNPIVYYANRSSIQDPGYVPQYSQIQYLSPKIVVFSPNESMDFSWNRQELIQFLKNEDYHLLGTLPGFEIWIKNIVFSDILVLQSVDSIEIRDPFTRDKIPNVNIQGYVVPLLIIDGQPALFEHPVSKGVIRTNYLLDLSQNSALSFGIGLDEKSWNPLKGDGVQFEIYCQSGGNETCLFSQYIDPKNNPADRKWHYYTIPFDTCWGSNTTISFATSSGPKNNNAYDWAYWINPRIEVKQVT